MSEKYNKTLLACYLGFITQAITANFTPLLFLMFNKNYEVSLGKIALIPAMFFLTQLVVDIICAQVVDKIGYRKCIITSCLCSTAGACAACLSAGFFCRPVYGDSQKPSVLFQNLTIPTNYNNAPGS